MPPRCTLVAPHDDPPNRQYEVYFPAYVEKFKKHVEDQPEEQWDLLEINDEEQYADYTLWSLGICFTIPRYFHCLDVEYHFDPINPLNKAKRISEALYAGDDEGVLIVGSLLPEDRVKLITAYRHGHFDTDPQDRLYELERAVEQMKIGKHRTHYIKVREFYLKTW